MPRAGFAGASLLCFDIMSAENGSPDGWDCHPSGCPLATALASGDLLPRRRAVGPLTLDLIHRDASKSGKWLYLHPREFALLWRLSDRPGAPVTRGELSRDVWRLKHVPETNSVAVHVSRLRAKLAAAGCAALVETDPTGSYRLNEAA